jgi:hypothetical protein
MTYFSQLSLDILKKLSYFFRLQVVYVLFHGLTSASSLEIDESSLEKAENFSASLVLV